MDKRARAALFRERLEQAMTLKGVSRSALAREIGVDRSTISQLLSAGEVRLPNVQLAADAAAALGVSMDWLAGLTERPERPGDLIANAMTMTDAARSAVDAQLMAWHEEARGYKIRHVPATLPDFLKMPEVIAWEYAPAADRTTDQAIGATEDAMAWLDRQQSDYEIAMPLSALSAFAAGTGYWFGLDRDIRAEQMRRMAEDCERLYPTLRLFQFDMHRVYSAPITTFGPILAVIYLGQSYLAFRESSRVASLSRHFDRLVREAEIDARDAAAAIRQLRDRMVR